MLQRNEVEMVMMTVLMVKVMMMIPMKSSLMVVTMAMISPSPGGISPVDFCLPESFLLSVFHVPQRRQNSSARLFLGFFPGGINRLCGGVGAGPGGPHLCQVRP